MQQANVLLPQPPPQSCKAQVLGVYQKQRYIRRRYPFQRRKQFRCVAELPDGSRYTVEVSELMYAALRESNYVDFHMHQGALGMEYFTATLWGE